MFGYASFGDSLTDSRKWAVFVLTLSLSFFPLLHPSRADPPPAQVIDQIKNDNKVMAGQVMSYFRQQHFMNFSFIPNSVRDAASWVSSDWRKISLSDEEDSDPGSLTAEQARILEEDSGFSVPMQLSSHLHHKGFLPTHDAMMMGAGFDQDMIGKKLQMTMRPFWGQNWYTLRHYWGGDVALNIDRRPDALPWGKIALGYVKGDESLTDHGSGADLHVDINLTEGWTFTSGLRQDDSTGDSNYMMLKWQNTF